MLRRAESLLIMLVMGLAGAFAQTTIAGTITDPEGKPLEGVVIVVKQTTRGAIADAQGRYSIEVRDAEEVLVFTYPGYASREIVAAGQQMIDLTMTEEVLLIEEVVIIGYGSQEYGDITGSIVSVKGAEIAN
ncbi:MAG: hypothetical protein OHK0039_35370 [Bacteroidia bacterium]